MKRHSLLLAALFAITQVAWAQPLRLRSDLPLETSNEPAWINSPVIQEHQAWENNCFPMGNGSIGLSLMSSPAAESIILNEKTLWTGGPAVTGLPHEYWDVNKKAWPALPAIRAALLAGNHAEADALTRKHFNGIASYEPDEEEKFRFGHYTVAGQLKIKTGINSGEVEDFERAIALDSAVSSITFRKGNCKWKREIFVSYPDNVAVLRFSSDTVQHLEIIHHPGPCLNGSTKFLKRKKELIYSGALEDNGLAYVLRLRVDTAADVSFQNGRLLVDGQGPIVLYLTEDTAYRFNDDPDFRDRKTYTGTNPSKTTADWIRKASSKGYDLLLERHLEDYTRLFGSFSLALNPGQDDFSGESIEKRLAAYRGGRKDYGLEALYPQFGRYLLISSSRAGNLPANLQGIWSDMSDGPWHVDYHLNINLQMNYWPALSGNLSECALPYIDYIRSLVKPGRATAQAYYDAAGWTASISGNPYGFTAPLSSPDMTWNLIPAAGPWLAADLWNYYDFTRDRHFLEKTAYPIIAESARFVCDYLWERPDGQFTAAPSTSPEHGRVDMGAAFVHSVCRELLTDALRAHEVLSYPIREEQEEWAYVLEHIAPYQIGRYGQLMEWQEDIDDPADQHRHVNHLFGLHPGTEITPAGTPELAEAAKVVLNHRGDGATGWSMGWKLNLWARLHDGNHAYKLFRNLLTEGTYDNLWCAHPPFQIDGNFGGAAGLIELLVQSHDGNIQLLPALPEVWKSGKMVGASARGNYTVNLEWDEGKLTRAIVHAGSDGCCRISYLGKVYELELKSGEKAELCPSEERDGFEFRMVSSPR